MLHSYSQVANLVVDVVDGDAAEAGGGVEDGGSRPVVVVVLATHQHEGQERVVLTHHAAPVGKVTVGARGRGRKRGERKGEGGVAGVNLIVYFIVSVYV